MKEILSEINEIRKEIRDFKKQANSDNTERNGLLEKLSKELQIQNDLLATISSKLGAIK